MIVCVGLIPVLDVTHLTVRLALVRPTFLLETVGLWAFGLSWLAKGGAPWRDPPTGEGLAN
jgi:hypothetical protein